MMKQDESSTRSSSPAPSMGSISNDDGAMSPARACSKTVKCRFNDCDNFALEGTNKCAFHKNRRQCCVENCTNQVYARKLCVRHGGKKQCQADNCDAHARGGGYCLQHGGFVVKRFCIVEGCSKQAHARQKCVRHGGGRRCKVEGCTQHARAGGLCNRHSHGHNCRVEGCTRTAQHSGSICFRHAMEMRAHGEQVPELNISKGGRVANKKRHLSPLLQDPLQDVENQPHQLHQQDPMPSLMQQHVYQPPPYSVPQGLHHVATSMVQLPTMLQVSPLTPSTPMGSNSTLSSMPPSLVQPQQQQVLQPLTNGTGLLSGGAPSLGLGTPSSAYSSSLKISLPTPTSSSTMSMSKLNTMRTPTNGFPTPRTHDYQMFLGYQSPQIDNSQLPSVMAMNGGSHNSNNTGGVTSSRAMYENLNPSAAITTGPQNVHGNPDGWGNYFNYGCMGIVE